MTCCAAASKFVTSERSAQENKNHQLIKSMFKNQMSVNMGSPGQPPTQDAESWQEPNGVSGHSQNALAAKATFEKTERERHKPT